MRFCFKLFYVKRRWRISLVVLFETFQERFDSAKWLTNFYVFLFFDGYARGSDCILQHCKKSKCFCVCVCVCVCGWFALRVRERKGVVF